MRRAQLNWTTVYANSGTERVLPATPWMAAGPIVAARATFEIREKIGDIEVGVGIEVANVTSTPPANTSIEARKTTNGEHFGGDFTPLTTTTKGRQLARMVWLVKNTSTSDFNVARVGGVVEIETRNSGG